MLPCGALLPRPGVTPGGGSANKKRAGDICTGPCVLRLLPMATTSLLVCDDSAMARKQLLRALPEDWPVEVSQATNGVEALQRIREGGIDLLLLDLTMPKLDGYGVLAGLRDEGLECKVIVVSGDVQDEAVQARHRAGRAGLPEETDRPRADACDPAASGPVRGGGAAAPALLVEPKVNFRDAFREVINVAMGRAAALLARVLGVFVRAAGTQRQHPRSERTAHGAGRRAERRSPHRHLPGLYRRRHRRRGAADLP